MTVEGEGLGEDKACWERGGGELLTWGGGMVPKRTSVHGQPVFQLKVKSEVCCLATGFGCELNV